MDTFKNKIIYIGQFIPPDKNAVAQRVNANAKLFEICGYEPVLIGCSKEIKNETQLSSSEFETYALPYPNTCLKWLEKSTSISDYQSILTKIGLDHILMVISCDLQSIAQSKMRKFLQKHKVLYVEDTMEWIRHSRRRSIQTMLKDADTYFRMRVEHIRTRNLICISKTLEDYYIKRGCNTIKIPVLVDWAAKKWDFVTPYMPNAQRTFIYAGDAGGIGYKERLDYVIKEACHLKEKGYDILVKIIGMDRDSFAKQCPEIASQEFFLEVTKFYGRQPHSFCINEVHLADASIIIRENTHEMRAGFPTKLSESLCAGTPPIITSVGNYCDYITDGVDAFFLQSCSSEAVGEVLQRICEMSDEALVKMHQMCRNNRSFDYRKYKEPFHEFVNQICYTE